MLVPLWCGLTAPEIHLVRRSFGELQGRTNIAALIFYQRLFALNPALRRLFHGNIEEQALHLMDKLSAIIGWLEHPGRMERDLEELGARHVSHGAKASDYATVAQALLDTFAALLGDTFNAETRAAWVVLYGEIQAPMLRGAAAAATETSRRLGGHPHAA